MYFSYVLIIEMTRLWFVVILASIVQGTFSQAIFNNPLINNGLSSNIPTAISANNIASWPNTANNLGTSYNGISGHPITGNVLAANAIPNNIPQNSNIELAANIPLSAITSPGVPLSEVTPIGVGDVAVTGEIPVGGTTAVSGNVPVIGYVTFEGYLPAGGMVTVANCGCNGEAPMPIV